MAILTKTAQAQISDLQAMIDRYLDDDTYKAYTDALERAQGEVAAKDKAKAKAKTAAPAGQTRAQKRLRYPQRPSRRARTTPPAKTAGPPRSTHSVAPACPHGKGTPAQVERAVLTRTSHGIEPAPAFSWSLVTLDFCILPLPNTFASIAPPRNRRRRAGVERLSMWLYQVGDHPGELEHLLQLLARVLLGGIAQLGFVDAVLQKRDRRVHFPPLALGHDDPKGLHDVFEGLEPVAPVADDVHAPNDAPGDQLAQARRDIGSAHVEQTC